MQTDKKFMRAMTITQIAIFIAEIGVIFLFIKTNDLTSELGKNIAQFALIFFFFLGVFVFAQATQYKRKKKSDDKKEIEQREFLKDQLN